MQSFRDTVHYKKDLSSRISRKVITSAQKDQLALDGGPVPGHSLFTGTLIDGFNWGKADLDGNGLISSSELGLFIQQQVAQASQSKQTPDFGSFHLDDRGEMVISLQNQSFDALKARAFSALQKGDYTTFEAIIEQLISIRSSSPEVLYLEYRLMFFKSNFGKVAQIVEQLSSEDFNDGIIPISKHELWDIDYRLNCWDKVLAIPELDFPLQITFLSGPKESELQPIEKKVMNEISVYPVGQESVIQLCINNPTKEIIHVYMIQIDSRGVFRPVLPWKDQDIVLNGLRPGETKSSYYFRNKDTQGIIEIRLFACPMSIGMFVFGDNPHGFSIANPPDSSELQGVKMKAIYYTAI